MDYWEALEDLVRRHGVVRERARSESHPRHPGFKYTVD